MSRQQTSHHVSQDSFIKFINDVHIHITHLIVNVIEKNCIDYYVGMENDLLIHE